MKKLITVISGLAVGAVMAASVPANTEVDATQAQTQTWEQKQEAIKTCAAEQTRIQNQIKTLTQTKEAAQTDAEKAQLQEQIQQKESELLQAQTRYQSMIASQTKYKYEFKDMNGDGANDNVVGVNDPTAKAYMYKNGYGYGYGFVDENGDGINDQNAEMTKTRLQSREKVKGKSQHGSHGSEQDRTGSRGSK